MEKNVVKINRYRIKGLELTLAVLLMLAFIGFIIFSFLADESIRSYEVQSEALSNEFSYQGLAVRNETLVYSDRSGYIIYSVDDQKRVSTNGSVLETVSSISEDITEESASAADLKNSYQGIKEIRDVIDSDLTGFNGDDMSAVSDAYEYISDLRDSIIAKSRSVKYRSDGLGDGTASYAPSEGIISYVYFDTSGMNLDEITSDLFLSGDTPSASNYTGSHVEKGSFLYRLCNDENWTILAKVSESFYLSVIDRKKISFRLENEVECTDVPCRLLRIGDEYVIELEMHEYMSKFINKKHLNITFKNETEQGYKIPVSAICEKDFYMIPNDLVVLKEGQTSCGLNVVETDEKGNEKIVLIDAERYYNDDEYTYISCSDIDYGSKLVNDKTGENYTVSLVKSLEGVFCINKGYTVFRRIERISSTKDYCIIKKDTSYGLALYDHIVLDASKVDGSMII